MRTIFGIVFLALVVVLIDCRGIVGGSRAISRGKEVDDVVFVTMRAVTLDKVFDQLLLPVLNSVVPELTIPALDVPLGGGHVKTGAFNITNFSIATGFNGGKTKNGRGQTYANFHKPSELEVVFSDIDIALPQNPNEEPTLVVDDVTIGAFKNLKCMDGYFTGVVKNANATIKVNITTISTSGSSGGGGALKLNFSSVNSSWNFGELDLSLTFSDPLSPCALAADLLKKLLHESLGQFLSSALKEFIPQISDDIILSILNQSTPVLREVALPPLVVPNSSYPNGQYDTVSLALLVAGGGKDKEEESHQMKAACPSSSCDGQYAANHQIEGVEKKDQLAYPPVQAPRDVTFSIPEETLNAILVEKVTTGELVLNVTTPIGTLNTSIISPIWPGAYDVCVGCAFNIVLQPTPATAPKVSFVPSGSNGASVTLSISGAPTRVNGFNPETKTFVPLLDLLLTVELVLEDLSFSSKKEENLKRETGEDADNNLATEASIAPWLSAGAQNFLVSAFSIVTREAIDSDNNSEKEEILSLELVANSLESTLVKSYCGHTNIPEVSSIIGFVVENYFIPELNLDIKNQGGINLGSLAFNASLPGSDSAVVGIDRLVVNGVVSVSSGEGTDDSVSRLLQLGFDILA